MNRCINQYGIAFDLDSHDRRIGEQAIDKFAEYLKKHFRIGVNTIDDVVKEFKDKEYRK